MSKPKDNGIVMIHGKEYLTVSRRVNDFRSQFPDYKLDTEILHIDDANVVIKATISCNDGKQISSGIAHEVKGAGNINRTSHIENAETSAVGRALAFFGMAGTEIASADEVVNAINQGKEQDNSIEYMDAVRTYIDSIHAIKMALEANDYETAAETESELPLEVLQLLWKAPSKGGIWTTDERTDLRSDEMNAARKLFKREESVNG